MPLIITNESSEGSRFFTPLRSIQNDVKVNVILSDSPSDVILSAAKDLNLQKIYKIISEITNTQKKTVSLTFTNNKEIQKLNKKYRNKDSPTDVLSFPYQDPSFPGSEDMLGEIYISSEQVKIQAKKYKNSIKNETIKLFIHGYLHLCGYTHENEGKWEKMEAMSLKILKQLKIKDLI